MSIEPTTLTLKHRELAVGEVSQQVQFTPSGKVMSDYLSAASAEFEATHGLGKVIMASSAFGSVNLMVASDYFQTTAHQHKTRKSRGGESNG